MSIKLDMFIYISNLKIGDGMGLAIKEMLFYIFFLLKKVKIG